MGFKIILACIIGGGLYDYDIIGHCLVNCTTNCVDIHIMNIVLQRAGNCVIEWGKLRTFFVLEQIYSSVTNSHFG